MKITEQKTANRIPLTGGGGTGSQWAWVLNHWSDWQGSGESYERVTPAEAAQWLIINGHEEALATWPELAEHVEDSEV